MRALAALTIVFLAAPAAAEGLSPQKVLSVAEELATKLGMPAPKRRDVFVRLQHVVEQGQTLPVTGVFAFQMGGGGLLVNVKKGKGVARLPGRGADLFIRLEAVSFGAQIGGSSDWGIGLILGLRDAILFGADYTGGVRSATMGRASVTLIEVTKKSGGPPAFHKLLLVGSGSGATAEAGTVKLTVTPVRAM